MTASSRHTHSGRCGALRLDATQVINRRGWKAGSATTITERRIGLRSQSFGREDSNHNPLGGDPSVAADGAVGSVEVSTVAIRWLIRQTIKIHARSYKMWNLRNVDLNC
jgi:hypothetical protein